MKKSLLVLSLFSLSACSSMRSNTLIDNDFIMSQEQDHREVIETPIAESKLITDEFLSVTLSNGEKINGLIISNYTSGRDSNRGGCAQSCRFQFTTDDNEYLY